jgi:diguanylate cyclase (GGDEF)-like protein/PAS domain S-box-containing protein
MDVLPRWEDEELRAFAADGTIIGRDRGSRSAPTGDWLDAGPRPLLLPDAHWPPELSTYHPDDRLTSMRAFMDARERPNEVIENLVRWRDGEQWRLMRTRRVNLFDDDRVGALLVTFLDLGTTDVAVDVEKAGIAEHYDAPNWVIQQLDELGTIVDTEGMALQLVGRTADELVGTWALDLFHPDLHSEIFEIWNELLSRPGGVRTVQLPMQQPDGDLCWVEATLINRLGPAGEGSILAVFHDISEKRATQLSRDAALHHRAEHDPLTQVLNRAALDACIEASMGDGTANLAVMFLDLDGFKALNDTHGHDAGDLVLRAVADRLKAAVRPTDEIGRYGGDEFVAVCHGVGRADQAAVVGRLAAVLEIPVTWPGGSWVPRASIGVARHQLGETVGALLRRADESMFEQKDRRRAEAHARTG